MSQTHENKKARGGMEQKMTSAAGISSSTKPGAVGRAHCTMDVRGRVEKDVYPPAAASEYEAG